MIYIFKLMCNFTKFNQISTHYAKTFPPSKKRKLTVYYDYYHCELKGSRLYKQDIYSVRIHKAAWRVEKSL